MPLLRLGLFQKVSGGLRSLLPTSQRGDLFGWKTGCFEITWGTLNWKAGRFPNGRLWFGAKSCLRATLMMVGPDCTRVMASFSPAIRLANPGPAAQDARTRT